MMINMPLFTHFITLKHPTVGFATMGNFKKKMKQKCDIGGQISNQIVHNKFSIFLIRVHQSLRNKYWYKDKKT